MLPNAVNTVKRRSTPRSYQGRQGRRNWVPVTASGVSVTVDLAGAGDGDMDCLLDLLVTIVQVALGH
jgi:hypothetical protein